MIHEVSFKNSKGLTLRGNLWPASSKSIIIMAHGSGSNRFASGLFTDLAKRLNEKNYNILVFDFSGHGKSTDTIFTLNQSVDDVASAIHFVKKNGYENIMLLGHSLGAYACLKNYSPTIKRMVLIGGLTGPVDWSWEDMCTKEQINNMKKTGYIEAEVNDGLRAKLKIDGKLLDDLRAINEKELLQDVKCPVLIIHGDADQQERDLYKSTRKGIDYFPSKPDIKCIKGASHSFLEKLRDLISLVVPWLQSNF